MTRQTDVKVEERETRRRNALVRALEYGLPGALESQGVQLLGFAIKYDAFNCLMTVKADVAGVRSVCFVGSDSIINCILRAESEARSNTLRWRPDQYHTE